MEKARSIQKRQYPWRLIDFFKISLFLIFFIFFYSLTGAIFQLAYQPVKKLLDISFSYVFNFFMLFAINKIFFSSYQLNIDNLWKRQPSLHLVFILVSIQSIAILAYLFYPFLYFIPQILSFPVEIFSFTPLFYSVFWSVVKFKILPRLTDLSFLSNFFLSIVVGPFWEELFFRGILQNFLLQKTRSWLAIFLSSLIFALFHLSLSSGLDIGFYNAFLGSLFTGYFYYKTYSLSLAFILHASNNLFIILFRLFT